jgi:hypothetical protein
MSPHEIHEAIISNKEICTVIIYMGDLANRKIPGESIPIDELRHLEDKKKRKKALWKKEQEQLFAKWYYIVHLMYGL